MKKSLLSLFFALVAMAATAQVDNTFCFVDEAGNELNDGAVVIATDLFDDGWNAQMDSGLSIKNKSAQQAHASLLINIERIDNGSLSHCFPVNCYFYGNTGEITRAETGTIAAGVAESIHSEWCPTGEGLCTVTYTIRVMEPSFGTNYSEVAKGPSVTVHFCNGVYPANVDAVNAATKANRIYNLQGQRVSNAYKGLVVVNGKKVVM